MTGDKVAGAGHAAAAERLRRDAWSGEWALVMGDAFVSVSLAAGQQGNLLVERLDPVVERPIGRQEGGLKPPGHGQVHAIEKRVSSPSATVRRRPEGDPLRGTSDTAPSARLFSQRSHWALASLAVALLFLTPRVMADRTSRRINSGAISRLPLVVSSMAASVPFSGNTI